MEATVSSSSEELFLRLYSYDFKGSPKFVEGWKKIRQLVKDNITESYIKAQVFFYSKLVEPVDLNEYYQWLKSSGRNVDVIEFEGVTNTASHPDTEEGQLAAESDSSESDKTGKYPANFAELIEMIQAGVKLPGVEELNIEPTNENPSPAQMDRPKKPWET